MKISIIKVLLILTFIILTNSRTSRSSTVFKNKGKTLNKAHLKTTYWVRPLIKTATSYHSFANLAYCPGDVINQLSCPLCSSILDNSFEVFKFHKFEERGYTFTFVILYSANRNEVVISFSGPKNPNPAFYSTIYSRGFQTLRGHPDILVEKTYLDVYEGNFSKTLKQHLRDYQVKFNAKNTDHKYVFVGHNFGGSLATLAAFDLISRKVIHSNVELDSPVVYSYGALRIGDANFVEHANKAFRVVRVVKQNDMYPRMPTCTFSPSLNRFRCEEEFSFEHKRSHDLRPELRNYIQNYFGKEGGLHAGIEEPFRGNRMTHSSFIEKRGRQAGLGWSYSANNPGYMINSAADPFEEHGRTNDKGLITYSQPLGAEILFSNNFKRHRICQYYYGIPNCEKTISPEFDPKIGVNYFNSDLSDC